MTKNDKLVTMKGWRYEHFHKVLHELLGDQNPDDPKVIKRRQISSAATALFIRHGYRKTSISDVAERAQVAKGTVYLYFKSKPEILVHAIAEEKKQYLGLLKPILAPDRPPRARLREWIEMVLVVGSEMPLTAKLLSGDPEFVTPIYEFMDAHKDEGWEEMQRAFVAEMVTEALGDHCLTRDEIDARAKVLLALAYFSPNVANDRIRGGLTLARFAALFAAMIVDGVGASKPPR
jgi:AcrR family transcriptional regulator